ncbi:MAG: Tetratricopeptide repeat protein [Methanomassiliicoccales archaeon PtaU1.Bin124]|nr:MAG: Tetratricopeptide repeat protein [Methanomassiliicoccales archaeon PtaU1.Bin124]
MEKNIFNINNKSPMIGRENEVQIIMDHFSSALTSKGNTILISGEAGIGKTRLCNEFLRMISAINPIVLQGACDRSLMSPFGPFRRMIQNNTDVFLFGGAAQANRRTDDIIEYIFGLADEPSHALEATLFRFYDHISYLASKRPVIILVEDLHMADSGSIHLFHFIARNIAGTRALMIGTYRPEDTGRPDQVEGNTSFNECASSLLGDNTVTEIKMAQLPDLVTREIVAGILPGQVGADIMDPLVELGEGNPLFIIESIKWLTRTEQIVPTEGGRWEAKTSLAMIIPKTIYELVSNRLTELDRGSRDLLDLAAVIGQKFTYSLLAKALERPVIQIVEELEELEKKAQFVDFDGCSYGFVHERFRRVVYDEIAEEEKHRMHGKVGNCMVAMGVGPDDYARLSDHFLLAGMSHECIDYSVRAGTHFASRMEMIEALPFYQRALDLIDSPDLQKDQMCTSLEGAADALMVQERYPEAIVYYDRLLNSQPKEKVRARGLRKKAECSIPGRMENGSFEIFKELLNEALEIDEIEPFEIAEILSNKAGMETHLGHYGQASEFFQLSIDKFSEIEAWGRMAMEVAHYSDLLLTIGKTSEALAYLSDAVDHILKDEDPRNELEVRIVLGETLIHQGVYDEANVNLNLASRIAEKLGENGAAAWANYYLALMMDDLNELEEALFYAEKGRDQALKTQSQALMAVPFVVLAHCYARSGRLSDAEKLIDDAVIGLASYSETTPIAGMAHIVRGEVSFYRGNGQKMIEEYSAGIELFSNCYMELLHRALGEKWFASRLAMIGKTEKAREHFLKARGIYQNIDNPYELERIDRELNAL